jgi:hypothetical protein
MNIMQNKLKLFNLIYHFSWVDHLETYFFIMIFFILVSLALYFLSKASYNAEHS